jgi:hypothetical protein
MFKFIHHLLNPHSPDCLNERQESRICDSCETLKIELNRLRQDNEKLLNRILNPISTEIPTIDESELKPIRPPTTHVAWRVRRQALEAESRATAKLMREVDKQSTSQLTSPMTTEELEKELGVNDNGS